MAGQGRSVESWNALAPSTRRRWIHAFGSEDAALEAYRNGAISDPGSEGSRVHTGETDQCVVPAVEVSQIRRDPHSTIE